MRNFYPITKFATCALSLLLVACTNDVYREDIPTPDKDPISGSTDATFITTKPTQLSVRLNDEYDGKRYYTVEVFTLNPILYPDEAKVISNSSQKVNKNVPYENVEFQIPDMLDNIYVCVTNPRGYKRVYECAATEGSIVCDTEADVDTKAAAFRATADKPNFTLDPNAIEIAKNSDWKKLGDGGNKACKITGEVNCSTLPWNVTKLYVTEKGKLTGLSGVGDASIYVLQGGTIEFTDLKLNQWSQRDFAIEKGGKAIANSVVIGSASLRIYNEGSFIVNGGVTANNGGISVYNACYLKCKTFLLGSGAKLNLLESSYLEAEEKFDLKQGTLSLDGLAQLKTPLFLVGSNTISIQSSKEVGSLIWADQIKESDKGVLKLPITGEVELYAKNGFDLPHVANIAGHITNGLEGKGASTFIPKDEGGCNPVGNKGESEDDGFTEDSETSDLIEGDTQPYTYMFEDNWPVKGDYDMNDLVMGVVFKTQKNGQQTTGVEIEATLYAIGANKKLGVAFQVDGLLPSDVTGVELNGSAISLESGQKYAVVNLFDNAHEALGAQTGEFVNTYNMNHFARTYIVSLSLKETTGSININNFNLFLVPGDMNADKRAEIHLPMFKATDRANVSKEYKYITQEDNLMWGVYVPTIGTVCYPKERVNLVDAFENVNPWLVGGQAPGWYANPIAGKVISYTEPVEK